MTSAFRVISRFITSFFHRRENQRSDTEPETKAEDEPSTCTLSVVTKKCGWITLEVFVSENGSSLKKIAVKRFSSSSEVDTLNDVSNCKLIRSKTKKIVGDHESLKDLKIEDNEEFVLVPSRPKTSEVDYRFEKLAGPNELQILKKTLHAERASVLPTSYNVVDLLLEEGDVNKPKLKSELL